MAQAKTRTATAAPKKAKAPVVCAMCDQEIDDETPLEGPEGMYHADCLKAANRLATNTKPSGKRAAPVVADDDEDEDEEGEDEEDDEEELEDEEDEELEDEEPVEPSDEDEDEEGDEEEGEEDEDEEEGEEEEDEDEEPAPKPRAKATVKAPAKPTPAERMAAARAAKAAKKTAAVEEYDEEDEPAPKPAKKAAAAGTTTKAPAKPKVEVRIPSNVTLVFTDNPARAGTKRWAVLEAMARVPREAETQSNGPGSVGQLHRVATNLMSRIAKANPGLNLSDKDIDTKSLNIPWFATDKGKADIFKNGAAAWGIRHNEEADTYRIFKRAKGK